MKGKPLTVRVPHGRVKVIYRPTRPLCCNDPVAATLLRRPCYNESVATTAGFLNRRAVMAHGKSLQSGEMQSGEGVLLVDRKGRRYLKRLIAGHRIAIRGTVLSADDLIGCAEGSVVGKGEPERFRIFRPTYAEVAVLISRPAEPIFAKDAGLIVCRGDIRPGHTVIEIGVGAGLLSMALLRAVGPGGRLISYERREDFAEVARGNVLAYEGETPQWKIHIRDAADGIEEREVDRVFSDTPDPAALLDVCAAALRSGGLYISYIPTVQQLMKLRDALAADNRFAMAESFELLERSWHAEAGSLRPDQRMVGHTGFITITRCVGG